MFSEILGMGTEVHSKMYLPGYQSPQTLTSNGGHGSWSLLHENETFKNGLQYDTLKTWPVVNGSDACRKEQVRQMIMNHEFLFKHQLNELHRLYNRQKDLMNEIKSNELLKHQKAAGTPQSALSSSGLPTVGSECCKTSTSSAGVSSQLPFYSMGNTQLTSSGPSQSGVEKLQRRVFNLELPADEYISDMEEPEGVNPPNRGNEAMAVSDHIGETSGYNSSALSSSLYLERRSGFTSLNELIPTEKVSASTNVYKGVWPFAKKFPENPHMQKDRGNSNLHFKSVMDHKRWLTDVVNTERTRSLFCKSFGLREFNKPRESAETEACELAKRTTFGVEISQRDTFAKSLSDVIIVESPPIWAKPPSSLSQNRTSVHVNSLFDTSTQPTMVSMMLQQKPEVVRDRFHVERSSIPLTPGLKAVETHQNGAGFHPMFASTEAHSYHPSFSLGFPYADSNGCSPSKVFTQHGPQWHYLSVGSKSKSSTDVYDNRFLYRPRNQDITQGRLHWLEGAPVGNGPLTSTLDSDNSAKASFVKGNTVHDFMPQMCREQLKAQSLVPEKGFENDNAYSRHQIDLNRCLTEDETRIYLEAPVIAAKDVIFGEASKESNYEEPAESLTRVAAEALIATSSSQAREMQESAAHEPFPESTNCRVSDASVNDSSLLWFAEIVSSHEEVSFTNIKATSTKSDEEPSPDAPDYFEYMTLNLAETKAEEYWIVPADNRKEVTLSKQSQRGQSRRGRKRKDFQKDVLPSIASSLSGNEVTEDLQTFEGSIRESGDNGQSSLSHRNAGKVGRGRGGKRVGSCVLWTTSTVQAAVSQPQMDEQLDCGELQEAEETSVTIAVQGKRTRRPPCLDTSRKIQK